MRVKWIDPKLLGTTHTSLDTGFRRYDGLMKSSPARIPLVILPNLYQLIPIRSDYAANSMAIAPIRHSGEGRNPESPISENTAALHEIGISR